MRNTPANLLGLFQQRAVWSGAELAQEIGWRFGSSIHRLRRRGHDIRTLPMGNNNFNYQYKGFIGI